MTFEETWTSLTKDMPGRDGMTEWKRLAKAIWNTALANGGETTPERDADYLILRETGVLVEQAIVALAERDQLKQELEECRKKQSMR